MFESGIAEAGGSEPLLRLVLASMPYGLSIWNEKRRLVLCNQACLDMYRYGDAVRSGMSLYELCELTVALGNHPDMTVDELFRLYGEQFDACDDPARPLRTQKAIRGRFIRTTQVRAPGIGWIITHEDVTEPVEQQWMAELREKTLAEQNLRFNAALAHMAHGLSMYDAERRLVICNERYRQIYGLPAELCRPGTAYDAFLRFRDEHGVVPVDGADASVEHVLGASRGDQTRAEAFRLPDGRVITLTCSPMSNGGFLVTHQDVTLEVQRFEALEAKEALVAMQADRLNAAVNNMSQGLCMFDGNERLVICNEPYARIYNLPPELMRAGTTLDEILEYRFAHGMVPKAGREAYLLGRKRLVKDRIEAKDEVEMEDGRTIAIHHHPLADGGWVATHEDITEQRRIEARVRHLARHDALTDLPNRVLLREEMERLEAGIARGEIVAVLCLDLDHFKAVNDTLGHGVGDQVLVRVAQLLRQCSRDTDIVARLGGDEFAILVHALDGPEGAAAIADRIVRAVAEPMEIEGHHISIGTSIGIAVAPFDGRDAEMLLKNADLALYRAKSEGRGTYHFFEKGMDEALQHRRLLEQGLRVALARDEFRLMYQPLFDLNTNRVSCLEALLRWDHPSQGVIAPAEFIPVAEETGAINAIGEWVLHEACRAAAGWPGHVRVAVNLSPAQFRGRMLVGQVKAALAAARLDPTRLELEVTESLLLADTELTLQTLYGLRELGVRISMDDFGTGYSSLSYLRSFPFDKIKIDRSFMSGLGPREDSHAIIKAVIGLGQSLGMATTAEGIETEEQLAVVRAQGCNEVQGFLFSPPLPASGVAALLGLGTGGEPAAAERRAAGRA